MKAAVIFGPDGSVAGDILSPTSEGFANAEARVPHGFRVVAFFINLDKDEALVANAVGNCSLSEAELCRADILIRLGIRMGVAAESKRIISFLERTPR